METIKSRANQHIKHARKIRDGRVAGSFFVEGKRLIDELLKSRITIDSGFVSVRFKEQNSELTGRLRDLVPAVHLVNESVFSSLADTKTPQGVAATCTIPTGARESLEDLVKEDARSRVVVLHEISNPGNLGAVIRSAEAFGAKGLITTRNSSSPFLPASVRGSMGSVFRLPVWVCTDLEAALEWGTSQQLISVCADTGADKELSAIDWERSLLLVLGSEGHGLDVNERSRILEQYRIPISPEVESLNLAVAAGIVLYESARGNAS